MNSEADHKELRDVSQFWALVSSQDDRIQRHVVCLNDERDSKGN